MEWIVELMSTIGIFAGALLILVFIHELGHFLAAKLFGMRVERFSLGFPPKIFGIKKGETEYMLGATPLGGYVKISGMIDESMDTEHLEKKPEPWEFRSKPVWQRIVVITAGVIFNMILAVMIFAGIALAVGEQKIPNESAPGIYVADSSLVHEVGFRTGDKLVGVNGERVKYFDDLLSPVQLTKSDLSYMVIRNGQQITIAMPNSLLDQVNERGFMNLGNLMIPSKIRRIQQGYPAAEAGLKAGDEIVAVDGQSVQSWQELVQYIQSSDGAMDFTVERGNEEFKKTITPNENNKIGIVAMQPAEVINVEHQKYGLVGSIAFGWERTADVSTGIIQGFGKMFSGDISVRENLGGPVAIANITKEQTDRGGWFGFWNITAFLSITLAIMNILPIPVLDGGHLMFLIYEGITRREPSEKVRMALQQIGFVLIILLFILVTFNDILRLF